MHLAIVNNKRSTPSPNLRGSCTACGAPVIAKCGSQRVHHWAHLGKRSCDPWWESETEWHRNWKQNFPQEWQEVVQHDERTGEKHIADIRTAQGLTIEFQHSHLRPEEREARENFYHEIVWVVDGTRLVRDLPRFMEGARSLQPAAGNQRVLVHQFPEKLFPRNWLGSEAPVFFDFGSDGGPFLWCLMPQRGRQYAVIVRYSRQEFVLVAREDPQLLLGQSVLTEVDEWWATEQRRRAQANLPYWGNLQRSTRRPKPKPNATRWRRR